MLIETPRALLSLQRGQTARIELAAHARLRGIRGHAWITFDHDPRDIVLGPGDEFVTEVALHALACPLRRDGDPAELCVCS